MIPPVTEQAVPTAVMVFGWTRRRTSQFATGSITRRYPFFSQSGRIFIRFQQATRRTASRLNRRRAVARRKWRKATPGDHDAREPKRECLLASARKGIPSTEL